jgi:hypothetical protein
MPSDEPRRLDSRRHPNQNRLNREFVLDFSALLLIASFQFFPWFFCLEQIDHGIFSVLTNGPGLQFSFPSPKKPEKIASTISSLSFETFVLTFERPDRSRICSMMSMLSLSASLHESHAEQMILLPLSSPMIDIRNPRLCIQLPRRGNAKIQY